MCVKQSETSPSAGVSSALRAHQSGAVHEPALQPDQLSQLPGPPVPEGELRLLGGLSVPSPGPDWLLPLPHVLRLHTARTQVWPRHPAQGPAVQVSLPVFPFSFTKITRQVLVWMMMDQEWANFLTGLKAHQRRSRWMECFVTPCRNKWILLGNNWKHALMSIENEQ